jgi:hypothetical protein
MMSEGDLQSEYSIYPESEYALKHNVTSHSQQSSEKSKENRENDWIAKKISILPLQIQKPAKS